MKLRFLPVLALLLGAASFAQQSKHGDVTMDIQLTGAEGVPPRIRQAIQKEIGHTFTGRDDVSGKIKEMRERILDQFQQYGYFKAQVSGSEQKEKWNKGVLKEIDLTVNIDAGDQYKVGDIRFANAKAFDTATLRNAIQIQRGEIFNVEKMREGLTNVRNLYCAQGYVNLVPVPNTEIDEDHLLVNVDFDMDEGPQFRIGKLILDGIEPHPGDGQKLLDAWKTHVGQVYDCSVGGGGLRLEPNNKANQALEAILGSRSLEISVNNDSRTVDFRYEFADPR